jgi:[protein-PII] uridylyltransferase
MLTPDKPRDTAAEPFDERALVADLEQLADKHSGTEQELRGAVAQRLKAVLTDGRAQAEQLLLKDRQGRRCAERLCLLQDEIIRVLFEFAGKHLYPSENPSEAEPLRARSPTIPKCYWRTSPPAISIRFARTSCWDY